MAFKTSAVAPRTRWDVVPVSGLAGVMRWEDAWRALLATTASERLFMQPEWVLPWCQVFGRTPRMLLLSDSGQVRAGAVLVAERLGPGPRGALVLRPPGLGVSDYLDMLLPVDGEAERAALTLIDWLIDSRGWDVLDLPNLPSESPTAALIAAAAGRRGLPVFKATTYHRPFIALNGNWEEYLASRRRKLRSNLKGYQRHLAELGEVRYRHYTSPAEIGQHIHQAVEVHARRWRHQHTSMTFSSSIRGRRFYAAAAQAMAARGWLDLSTLELDGRVLAFCLGFVKGDTFYYYLPGFDPAYARFAPSTLLLAYLIETAYTRGLREFDFMLGEESYKSRWANGNRTTTRLVVGAPGLRGEIALAAFRAYIAIRERARRASLLQRARRYGLGRLITR